MAKFMDALKQLNTSDIRYLRYYIRSLHVYLDLEWPLDAINSYSHKELKNTFNDLIATLSEKYEYDFFLENYISNLPNEARDCLVDINHFDWLKCDRAKYFTWNMFKKTNFSFESFLKGDKKWKSKYSNLCCNSNSNIFNYIVWTFDDVEFKTFCSQSKNKIKHIKKCHSDFKLIYSKNKIKWIKSDNEVQLNWIYQYLEKSDHTTFISEPKDNSQLYNTVICQLDLICESYSNELETWTKFISTMKKAWSTQSTRLKKRNTEIKLDQGTIKMLKSITGKDATDTMLKKKLKEIIQRAYEAPKD